MAYFGGKPEASAKYLQALLCRSRSAQPMTHRRAKGDPAVRLTSSSGSGDILSIVESALICLPNAEQIRVPKKGGKDCCPTNVAHGELQEGCFSSQQECRLQV